MPHLHLSLQAGDDLILKRMKRRHLRADAGALPCADRVRAPRPGHGVRRRPDRRLPHRRRGDVRTQPRSPWWTNCGLTHLHVFPYSPRPGTPAARMPQVPAATRKTRAARLRAAGDGALGRFLESRIGCDERVLVEKPGFGHSAQFAPVEWTHNRHARDHRARPGEIVTLRIAAATGGRLQGRVAG